ncbi:unnamed protein product [Mytilus coruscus]|uniref:PHD-type domain-containing protein n=1 Tax=Mytilus coruscus TaxID=42192 RepID=A0A6J8A3B0_MYTCO|nr:unnamed protein product [Mytilus coruscus]
MALSSNPVLVLQIILIIQVVRYNTQIAEHHAPDQTNHISLLHKDNCHPYTGIFLWCRVNKIHRYPIKFSETYNSSLYRTLLLVIAGIELNPGPSQIKYPCGTCTKACKWGEKALACDECDTWYHATCAGINTQEYSKLANTSVSWYCMVCNAPNHTTVLYDLIDSAHSNTFSMLSISDGNKSSSINQDDSNISLGDPLAASSPKRVTQTTPGNKNKKALRTLIINFQSIKNKRTELPILIETANPDIIIGTETWLSNNIGNREIFPPELGYDVIRRDREKDPHEGVPIAAKNDLELSQVSINKEAEMITGKIKIGTKQYIITSFYRPPNKTDNKYVERTITEIHNLRNNNKRSIFPLGGDFNLPDIDWGKNKIKGNQLPQTINRAFLQMSADLSTQQINNNTTRGNNNLDLMFTSHPGNIDRCKTLQPIGNSDHDIVLVDITANVNKPKPTKRKINL